MSVSKNPIMIRIAFALQTTLHSITRILALLMCLTSSNAWSQEFDVCNPLMFDVKYYMRKHPDIARFYGGNVGSVKNHWVTQGLREGRQSSAVFSIDYYIKAYPDVAAVVAAGTATAAAVLYAVAVV